MIENAVVGCMATFPARYATLEAVVESIAPQLDWLIIYANETIDGFPDLSELRNVIVLDSNEHAGDLSANGKVFPFQFLRNCLVFTLDDDFLYPPDYVRKYRAFFESFDYRCCVTTHGSIFPACPRWYFDRSKVFSARSQLSQTQLVSLAGSGTFAFHQSTMPCSTDDFLPEVMVDLRFGLLARRHGLPIWCLPRDAGWLEFIGYEGLWESFAKSVTHHTVEVRKHDWSFLVYRDIANAALEIPEQKKHDRGEIDFALDPELEHGLQSGDPPPAWRLTRTNFMKRTEYLKILATQ